MAGVFFACLQRAFLATRGALGTVTAAAAGAAPATLLTLPLAFWPGPQIETLRLLGMALAICVALPPIEWLVRTRVLPRPRVVLVADGFLEELPSEARGSFEIIALVPRDGIGSLPSESDGATVIGLADFSDLALARVPPRWITAGWLGLLEARRPRLGALPRRAFDVVLATIGLLLLLPLWSALVLLRLVGRRELLFRQLRVGQEGRLFTMYKLRTMRLDAESPGEAIWAQASDPRVTAAGRFLRDAHVDELPQLWNVLRGEMSIVGPRPERPELDAMLADAIPHWTRRQAVKPGLTGWAQVRHGYAGDRDGSEEKLSYDLWYLRHRSLLLDLAICLRTVPTLLSRDGVPRPRPAV